MQKKSHFGLIIVILIILFAVFSNNGDKKTASDYSSDMNSWYKSQAKGKNYTSNDGGSYYCMGKNDTCPNKTHNAYDLYCDSCDPDGDNIEG